jgi:tRNA (guanine37-N1)-methyltransferase
LRSKLRNTIAQAEALKSSAEVYNAFDIVGDIVVLKLPDPSANNAQAVAKSVMRCHKKVKAVFMQQSSVGGEYRLRKLTCIGGENRTLTRHK